VCRLDGVARIRLSDLFRPFWICRHGDRAWPLLRPQLADELPLAVPGEEYRRVLAKLEHHALGLLARLRVSTARRQAVHVARSIESGGRRDSGRTLVWNRPDAYRMGAAARGPHSFSPGMAGRSSAFTSPPLPSRFAHCAAIERCRNVRNRDVVVGAVPVARCGNG